MAANYSDTTKLKHAKMITKQGGCFIVERGGYDVGIMSDYFEDCCIVEIAGQPLRKKESADWIYKRLSKKDEAAIDEACYKALDDARNDCFDEPYDDY